VSPVVPGDCWARAADDHRKIVTETEINRMGNSQKCSNARGIRMFRLPPKSIQIKRSTAPFGGLRGNLTYLQVNGRIPLLLPQTLFVKAAGCDWSSSHYGHACPPD
jgi:hypothetical protein